MSSQVFSALRQDTGSRERKPPMSAPDKSGWEFKLLLAQLSMTPLFLEAPLPNGQAQNDYG